MNLLSRTEFNKQVRERDSDQCVECEDKNVVVHHIVERKLFEDEGYYKDNGVCLCDKCHILAEQTLLTCDHLREKAGIKTIVLPDHLDPELRYDKWGNPYLNKDIRARGELFYDENVQKILSQGNQLINFIERTKYPKTMHLDFSPGLQNDDRRLPSTKGLEGEEIILALKMDGENTSLTRTYLHARSLDSGNHPSRNWIKALHAQIAHDIPENMVICGENLFAQHSIRYEKLPTFFLVFNIWEKGRRLPWDDTLAYCEMLGLQTVPVLYRGPWNPQKIQEICEALDPKTQEGAVLQVTREIRASEWKKTSAKFVRKGHVQTNKLWMTQPIIPNELAKPNEEPSFLGGPPKKLPQKPKQQGPEMT